MTDYSSYDKAIGKLQPGKDIVYDGHYHVADDTDKKLKKLEGDIDFLRGIITELYAKCPKAGINMRKKKNKDDTVECENCGGLLW